MEEKKRKLAKMVDEVSKFFLSKDATNININISNTGKKYIIDASGEIEIDDDEMEEIVSNLREHKDLEYDFFWELVGEYSDEEEFEIMFLLADEVRIYYENKQLNFVLEIS